MMFDVCERQPVSAVTVVHTYWTGQFFLSARKPIRYSVNIALQRFLYGSTAIRLYKAPYSVSRDPHSVRDDGQVSYFSPGRKQRTIQVDIAGTVESVSQFTIARGKAVNCSPVIYLLR